MKRMTASELEAFAQVGAKAGKAFVSIVVFACRAIRADDLAPLIDDLGAMNKNIDELAGIAAAFVGSIDA